MDKVRTKRILDQAGIPTLDCMEVSRAEWESDPEAFVARAESRYGYPAMVSPSPSAAASVSRAAATARP